MFYIGSKMTRNEKYELLSSKFESLNDKKIEELLEKPLSASSGLGGKTGEVNLNQHKVFFKRIPLTDTELTSENKLSTTNFFNLPIYFQYGLGSLGFGAWRELNTLKKASSWVLENKSCNFPILYHWRVVSRSVEKPTSNYLEKSEEYIKRWPPEPEIRNLFESKLSAKYELVVFIEHLESDLDTWLHSQFDHASTCIEKSCQIILNQLLSITKFTTSQNLLHFDLHFKNIMTDGHSLYLADFGLAISPSFSLSPTEKEFYSRHLNYDKIYSISFFVEWILAKYNGFGNWFSSGVNQTISQLENLKRKGLPESIIKIVTEYLPLAS